jgi:hypothetical protein
MTTSLLQFIAAIAMVGIAVILFVAYRTFLAKNSERRMRTMLQSVGLDPALAASGEIPTIMKDIRKRCRGCASEDVCERWLEGHKDGDNDFCPNAKVFRMLKKYGDSAA